MIAIDDRLCTYDEIFKMAQPTTKNNGFQWVLRNGWWAWTKDGSTRLECVVREEHTTLAAMNEINANLAKEAATEVPE